MGNDKTVTIYKDDGTLVLAYSIEEEKMEQFLNSVEDAAVLVDAIPLIEVRLNTPEAITETEIREAIRVFRNEIENIAHQ